MDRYITIADAAQKLDRSRSRVDQVIRELGIKPDRLATVRFLTQEQFERVQARILTPCKSGPKGPRKDRSDTTRFAESTRAIAQSESSIVASDRCVGMDV